MPNYILSQMDEMDTLRCPCGTTRRAFLESPDRVATLHLLDVQVDAQRHYHKRLTEIYLILEGEGHLELDGELVSVRPMTAVMIHPGCRHRAVGKLRVAVIPVPAFDPQDEWFD
jgi:mannose-6-phosphate isomerase-like protein (cupin superfamily)